MRAALLVSLLAACGGPSSTSGPPSNVATGGGTRVNASTDLGALALIPVPRVTDDHARFVPVSHRHVIDPSARLAPGAYVVLDAKGARADVSALAPEKVPFGCDGNAIDAVPLDGAAALVSGVGWILPAKSTWKPRAYPVVPGAGSETSRVYDAGPVRVVLDRERSTGGHLVISANEHVGARVSFERVLMEGAPPDLAVVDLRQEGPGVPVPVGVWAISDEGPYLVTLYTPAWEGVQLDTYLVDTAAPETDGAKIEALSMYLYQCAF